MEIYRLRPTNRDDFEFEGELLCRSTSERHQQAGVERAIELSLYRDIRGQFVVVIEYNSTSESEHRACQLEVVDNAQDVEDVFMAFEPTEFVASKDLAALSRESRHQFQKELYQTYDQVVTTLLDAFKKSGESPELVPHAASGDGEAPATRPGIWRFLRRK